MIQAEKIVSDHLQLVPFGKQHLSPRYVAWLNDAEVVKFSDQRFRKHTLETCRDYWLSFEGSPNCFWAIELRSDGHPHIGNMNAYIDRENGVADVGILIGDKSCWGRGYGSEAWIAVVHWLTNCDGVRKVSAGTLSCNIGMLAVMRQAGMVDDGCRVRHQLVDGKEVDLVHMALFAPYGANHLEKTNKAAS